jgi:16S rRNA (guanine527-N7)-methyltransferase
MPKDHRADLSNDQIAALLLPFGAHPRSEQISNIRKYISILLKWNKLLGLTSVIDPAEIIVRHFGESIFLASLMPVENGRLADLGSGAGFPGLALKILCPGLHVILIESNKKKSAFLSEIVASLGLGGVEIIPLRFQEIRSDCAFADFITARAVGGFPELLRWSRKSLSHRGHIALWLGGEDTTRISSTPGWIWQPAVRIPESQRRFILIGRPPSVVTSHAG